MKIFDIANNILDVLKPIGAVICVSVVTALLVLLYISLMRAYIKDIQYKKCRNELTLKNKLIIFIKGLGLIYYAILLPSPVICLDYYLKGIETVSDNQYLLYTWGALIMLGVGIALLLIGAFLTIPSILLAKAIVFITKNSIDEWIPDAKGTRAKYITIGVTVLIDILIILSILGLVSCSILFIEEKPFIMLWMVSAIAIYVIFEIVWRIRR